MKSRLLLALTALVASSATAQPGTPYKEAWRFVVGSGALQRPQSVFVGTDCMVWIADETAGVYRIPCAGAPPLLVAAVGRENADYQMPWVVGPSNAQSVAVFDKQRLRVRTYTTDGSAREFSDVRLPEAATGRISGIALTSAGLRVWLQQYPNANDPQSLQSMVIAFNQSGTKRDTLARLDGVPSIYWGSTFAASHLGIPHHRRSLVAFSPDGGFVTGMSDGSTVSVFDAHGTAVREVQLEAQAARAINNADKDAYADSVKRTTDREMESLHYNVPEKKKYQAQIATYLREDIVFPAQRQLYDRFIVDASGEFLWVQISGTGKNYARTWEVYSLRTGTFSRRVTIPHKGAVISAAVSDNALYAIEQPLDGASRVVKYVE